MHSSHAIFAKYLEICKHFGDNLVNEKGNQPRLGVVSRFSDLEVKALSLAAESIGIDSENNLFAKLFSEYHTQMQNLISKRQYNDRRKQTAGLCKLIRERMADTTDGGEEYFCVDSKPIEVCRLSRCKRCKMGRKDFEKAPSFGYCASQGVYYYGYKLHAVCGISGVIHSFEMTKASAHDINYLNDVRYEYHDCRIFGDREYISASMQLDLFETAYIKLECPYRLNQKNRKPQFIPFAKARKRIETVFSQMCDQFMLGRNYAKETEGLFTRIIG